MLSLCYPQFRRILVGFSLVPPMSDGKESDVLVDCAHAVQSCEDFHAHGGIRSGLVPGVLFSGDQDQLEPPGTPRTAVLQHQAASYS